MDLSLVSYVDQNGNEITQFAIVGDKTVILIDRKEMGIAGQDRTPAGFATGWLREGILKLMGREATAEPVMAGTSVPFEGGL